MRNFLRTWLLPAMLVLAPSVAAVAQGYNWSAVRIGGGGRVTSIKAHPKVQNLFFITTDVGTSYRWNHALQRWEELVLGAKIPATYWNWANGAVTGDLAFDPNDVTGNTLYVTLANGKGAAPGQGLDTKGTVMKSTDRGDSWTDCGLAVDIKPNSDQTFTDRLVVDPNNSNVIWLATRSNGVWRSASAGVTGSWVKQTSISDTLFGRFIKFDVSGGTQGGVTKNMFIGTNYGIYRSTDGGATFAAMIGGPSGVRRASIAKNGVMFVTATPSSTNNGVWKWNGSGWSGVSPDNAREFKHVSVNPDNSNEVIAASTSSWASEKMWRSTSGGNLGTWTEMSHTRDKTEAPHSEMSTAAGNIGFSIDMVTFDPFNPGHVWFSDMINVNQTTDVWATPVHWKLRVAGLEEVVPTGQLTAPPTGRNVLLSTTGDVGGFDHQSLTEPPAKGMASYFSTATGINTSGVDVQFTDPNFIVRVGSDGWNGPAKGGYSTNGGVTYNNFPTFPGSGGARGRVAVSATSRNFVWVPMGGPSYTSNNLGATWTACSGLPNNVLRSGSIYEIYAGQLPIAADRVSGNLFYVYAQGVIYVSQDTGRTFTARATGLPNDGGYASYAHLEATPGKSGDVWFSHPAGLYHSVDSGKSFVHVNPSVIVSPKWMSVGRTDTSAAGHSVVYVTNQGTAINGTYYGVFRSDDNGANWTEISSRVPTVVSNMAADQFGRVFIGLNGNGIFVGEPVSGPVTGVGITPPADTLVETDSVKLNVTLVPLYPANRAYTLSSTNPSVATVDANGWVRALTAGTANIVVTTQDGGFTDTTAITVTPFIHLSSVALDTAIWMGIGNTVSLVPKILPLDATNKKLVWTTSDSTKVRVSSGGSVTALGFGTATVTATAVDGGATATITVKVNTIAAAINLGDTVQIGNFKRDPYTQSWLGTIRTTNAINLTGVTNPAPEGVYKTSRVGLDAINIGGLVPGGRYTMRLHFAELGATVGSGGRRFDIIVGTDTTKLYDIFNAAGGRYKAVVREYVVNASSAGGVGVKLRAYTNSTAINGIELVLRPVDSVSLPVTNAFVGINDTLRITPTVWPVEASNKGVTWVSSNTSVATVSTSGLITGTGVGTAVISVITDETGKRDSVLITADSILVDSVRLQQSADTVGVRNTRQLKATVYPANASDRFISWSSSDTGIVKVNAAGLLSGIVPGNVTVTVTTREGGKTASTSVLSVVVPVTQVNLTRSTLTIGAFDTTTIGATSLPSNASNLAVSWTSSDTTVATVSANGRITAIAAGNANITATAQDGQGANKVLPVTVIPVQNCGAISNGGFESGYYNWTGAGYTTSRISEVPADVHGGLRALILSGDGTAHNHIGPVNVPGGVPITVSFWAKTGGSTVPYWAGAGFDYIDSLGNKLGSASVVIHPGGTTPHVANYKQFFINGNAPAGTARLGLWVSKAGPVTSSIYLDDFCVTVNVSSVTTDAASATIAIGASRQLSAAVLPASATHPAVTWTSSNSGIAVVDSTGLVTGVAQGTANIIAASADGLKRDTVLVEVLHQLVNVNSGDTTEGAFHKDHSYTSGSATTTYNGVSTVGVANAAPTSVYVQRRYGDTFYYDFTGFTPGQRYVVRMHFVEPFYAQAGKRVFSVKANGADVLTSLDVFAEAGQNKALVKDVSAVADSIGNLRLLFTKDIDNAAVAGIEVLGSITDYEQVIAVNSADVAIDGFSADSAYTGGSASAATAISTINYNGTANAGPLALYGKRRYGNFTYNFTGLAGNGSYVLRLHFIEPWATTTGQRVMDVKVNDELKLDNLDLIAAGKNKRLRPILRDIAVMADTAGNLNVQFISVTDNAAVAGVELLQVPGANGGTLRAGDAQSYAPLQPKVSMPVLLSIAPNPVAGNIRFRLSGAVSDNEQLQVTVTSMQGREVFRTRITSSRTDTRHELQTGSLLKKGIYILQVAGKNYSQTARVVVL